VLSVLIVNWNTRDHLERCLRSLRRFAPKDPCEIVVVDNASTDGSADMVRAAFPDVILIAENRNWGYAKGNNLAAQAAQGEWLLTLNPDTEFLDDSLDKAVKKLQENADFGALGAKLVFPDGKTQRSVRGFPSFRGLLGELPGLAKAFPSYRLPDFDYEKEQPAPQPMGTFLLFRRKALAAVGDPRKPFDEHFPIFFNEVDLLCRLNKAGRPCLYSPEVVVRHFGGESTKQVRPAMIWESHRSLVRFLRKHYGRLWNAPGLWLLAATLYATAFVRARGYHAGFGT
jgi:N-acetylglucosaminyl-diphospho-decaprenol L-rhamnosyltransferase